MGRVITRLVKENFSECTISAGVDPMCTEDLGYPVYSSFKDLDPDVGDVIVDFSVISVVGEMLDFAVSTKTPAVICTTGYNDCQLLEISEASKKVAIFRSGNMSLGINLIIKLAETATKVLGDNFDIEVIEAHHNQKIDAPSGTALMIADAISNASPLALNYEFDRHSKRMKRPKNEIGIHSIRGGTIVGEHEIIFAGHDEVIKISHSAASKEVFAEGAINAATYLAGKAPGSYDMNDLLKSK